MIVLRKKRIISILAVAMVCLVFVLIQTVGIKNNKTVQTVTLPVTNKVIVVDAGHGVPDERC